MPCRAGTVDTTVPHGTWYFKHSTVDHKINVNEVQHGTSTRLGVLVYQYHVIGTNVNAVLVRASRITPVDQYVPVELVCHVK